MTRFCQISHSTKIHTSDASNDLAIGADAANLASIRLDNDTALSDLTITDNYLLARSRSIARVMRRVRRVNPQWMLFTVQVCGIQSK